jgi:hypothetical protein
MNIIDLDHHDNLLPMLPAIKENKGKITNLDHRCIIL